MQNRKRDTDYRTVFWTLWEKATLGCFRRTALKHVYYLGWNRSPTQVGCMRQALGPGALGRPRGSGWRWRWEGGSGWGTHVNPRLFHFNVWQNSLQKKKKKKQQLYGQWAPCLNIKCPHMATFSKTQMAILSYHAELHSVHIFTFICCSLLFLQFQI